MSIICQTPRLTIKQFSNNDADFIVKLLNEEAFIKNIVDKQVRNVDDAIQYLQTGPIKSYQQFGYGLCLIQVTATQEPIGMCGLLKREELFAPDNGYALLTEYNGQGFAEEAARAMLVDAQDNHNTSTVVAVTNPNNTRSLKLLQKLGFSKKQMITLYQDQADVQLLQRELQPDF